MVQRGLVRREGSGSLESVLLACHAYEVFVLECLVMPLVNRNDRTEYDFPKYMLDVLNTGHRR
jgi:hypothetical protein